MTNFHKEIRDCLGEVRSGALSAGANSGLVRGIGGAAGAVAWALADLADAIRDHDAQPADPPR